MPQLLMLHDVCGIRAHFVHVCTTLHLCELTHTAAHTAECLHLSLLLLMRCKLAAGGTATVAEPMALRCPMAARFQ